MEIEKEVETQLGKIMTADEVSKKFLEELRVRGLFLRRPGKNKSRPFGLGAECILIMLL